MADPTDLILRPSPSLRVRVTTAGALLRVEAAMVRDDERPLAPDLRAIAAALNQRAADLEAASTPRTTIHECRCCSAQTGIVPAGPVLPEGWGHIENINGPDAICPACVADPTALDSFRDEYPNAEVTA